jgi:hypothetical protein
MPTPIPPADEQLPARLAGIVDLNTRDELAARLAASHSSQGPLRITGDPTGRNAMRPPLAPQRNARTYTEAVPSEVEKR